MPKGRLQRLDLVGHHYGRLTVAEYAGLNKHSQSLWVCLCDCGTRKVLSANSLRRQGKKNPPVRSCGCLKKEAWKIRPTKNIKDGTFRCSGCRNRFPVSERVSSSYRCPPCNRTYHAKLYADDPQKVNDRQNIWREKNIQKVLFRSAKQRAARRGLTFTITLDDVKVPDTCPVLGIPLFPSRGKNAKRGWPAPTSPTLDRIDNTRGYEPGNVAVVSWRANSLKKDGTVEELEAIAKWLRKKT